MENTVKVTLGMQESEDGRTTIESANVSYEYSYGTLSSAAYFFVFVLVRSCTSTTTAYIAGGSRAPEECPTPVDHHHHQLDGLYTVRKIMICLQ